MGIQDESVYLLVCQYMITKEISIQAKRLEYLTYHAKRCKNPQDMAKLICMSVTTVGLISEMHKELQKILTK